MNYIISQVLAVISYIFLALTFIVKGRYKLLFFKMFSAGFISLSYLLLQGYTGVAINLFVIFRTIVILLANKYQQKNKILDYIIIIVLSLLVILITIFTYESLFSILLGLSSFITNFALWQKNVLVYRILGLVSTVLSITYTIFKTSYLAAICQGIIIICIVVKLVLIIIDIKKQKKVEENIA